MRAPAHGANCDDSVFWGVARLRAIIAFAAGDLQDLLKGAEAVILTNLWAGCRGWFSSARVKALGR